jgi:phosphoribosylglycinamide formyltransferase-1
MIGVLVSGEGTNLQARALERARAAGIPAATFSLDCHATREERDLVMATWLEDQGAELVVLAGYMHLLTQPFLDRFPERIVNVHPSLLPAFPGMRAIDEALAAGVDTTGVTVHLVDEGVDSGPVLRQVPVPVEPRESLVERIHAVEHRLLPEVVRELCAR